MRQEILENGTVVYIDADCAFGQDALLLANFAAGLHKKGRLLDLGTGCGILPLAMRDAGFDGAVTAIDIRPEAAAMTDAAVKANGFSDFEVLQADLRGFARPVKYDLVLCNPPYFSLSNGPVSSNSARRTARAESDSTLDDVAAAAARNLRQGGALCLCYRPERLTDLLSTLRRNRLEPKRLQFVRTALDRLPALLLLESVYDGGVGLAILPDHLPRITNDEP